MDAVSVILSLQFIFDWVVATIVGVSWCYLFKLAYPEASETQPGWAIYTLVQIVGMPFVRMGILRDLRQDEEDAPKAEGRLGTKKGVHGYRTLLNVTCSTSVSTSISGLLAMTFPRFADLTHYGPHRVWGYNVAAAVTVLYVLLQAGMEWLLHTELAACPKDGYWKTFFSILLCSTWSTIGFFWNVVWDRVLKEWTGVEVQERRQLPGHNGRTSRETFNTIMDYWYGRPRDAELHDALGMEWLMGKAAATLAIALLVLYLSPEPPPVDQRRFLMRRLRLAVQMVWLGLAAYSTTDVGFYFGTRYVARLVDSAWLGLAVAFGYAGLVTLVAVAAGCALQYKPETDLGRWVFQLLCFLVSYAWSYCWQELLFQIQGYGLETVNDHVEPWFVAWLAMMQTMLVTYLFAFSIGKLTQWSIRYAAYMGQTDTAAAVIAERLQDSTVGDSMRFLAACSGIPPKSASRDDLWDQPAADYGATKAEAAGLKEAPAEAI